jgi:hypothetical protein
MLVESLTEHERRDENSLTADDGVADDIRCWRMHQQVEPGVHLELPRIGNVR